MERALKREMWPVHGVGVKGKAQKKKEAAL